MKHPLLALIALVFLLVGCIKEKGRDYGIVIEEPKSNMESKSKVKLEKQDANKVSSGPKQRTVVPRPRKRPKIKPRKEGDHRARERKKIRSDKLPEYGHRIKVGDQIYIYKGRVWQNGHPRYEPMLEKFKRK
mgnify:CR=1 FL=1